MHRHILHLASTKAISRICLGRHGGQTILQTSIHQYSLHCARGAFNGASKALSSSSTTSPSFEEQPSAPSSQGPTNQGGESRGRRYGTLLSIAIFVSIGYASGRTFSLFLLPPPSPPSGSRADEAYLQGLNLEADKLPMVQELRAHREEWQELEGLQTSGLIRSIRGSFGIGYYRVFWNAKENRTVTIVHLGASLSGWPSVVHGGCLAALLQESMESLVQLARGNAVPATKVAENKQTSSIRTLQLKYKLPTFSGSFYIIRTEGANVNQQHQCAIMAHIEDARSGLITAEAIGDTSP